MKVYDKEIYEKQESIKFTVLVIAVFLVGFFAGYIACSFNSPKDDTKNQVVKIENVNNIPISYNRDEDNRNKDIENTVFDKISMKKNQRK